MVASVGRKFAGAPITGRDCETAGSPQPAELRYRDSALAVGAAIPIGERHTAADARLAAAAHHAERPTRPQPVASPLGRDAFLERLGAALGQLHPDEWNGAMTTIEVLVRK